MTDAKKVELKPVDFDPFALGAVERSVESTEAQRELWSSAQLGDEANCAFNESVSIDLKGVFDLAAFRDAVQAFADRHEALRGTFSDDGLLYTISEQRQIEVPFEEGEEALRRALHEEVSRPFDLHRGPLFRARVVRLGPEHHRALFTGHHAAFDGWSCAVLLEELGKLYTERVGGPAAELEPPGSFVAYAEDEARFGHTKAFAETLAYWKGQLADGGPTLDLPADRPRPPFRTFAADRVDVPLPTDLLRALKKFAAQQRTSFVSLMMAGYSAYLSRLSGQSEVVVGMPAAGQVVFGEDYLVGHCVNLLPVRLKAARTFTEHLAATKRILLDADEHRRLSYGRLLQSLKLSRDPSRIPLASVLFNVDQGMVGPGLKFGDLEVTFHSTPRIYETFELFVNASEVGGAMILEAQYNTALFDRETIALRMRELIAFYRRLLERPGTELDDLDVVDDATRARMLGAWNDTALDVDLERSVPALVVEAASERLDEDAVVDLSGGRLTYRALLDRAGALAARLRSEGIRPGDVVALCAERRVDVVAAVVGISATGAAYLPVDPSLPADRIDFMLRDAEAKRVVLHRALDAAITTPQPRTYLDDLAPEGRGLGRIDATPNGVAYLIYTSGSTGTPKGVMVPHRAVVNFLLGLLERPGLTEGTRFLATTTLSFDVSVVDLYLPLVAGGTTIMVERDIAQDGFRLAETLERERITAMTGTPSTWRMLLEANWKGHPNFKILCAGEAFPPELADPLLRIAGEVWNMYGPTEATVYATGTRILDPEAPITIGRPVPNSSAYVLDERGRLVPPGVTGELCIGGAGLAVGYKGRPDLTAERFIDNPVAGAPHPRVYRTGDEVTWRRDGLLFYVGRLDDQIKLRGYRIELGEIESLLVLHPAVTQAAAVVVEPKAGDQRLIAYLGLGQSVDDAALREHLARSVPGYMIPSRFERLDDFPLTPSGKVDKKALRARRFDAGTPQIEKPRGQGPRTDAERLLVRQFAHLLELDANEVGVYDNFFDLGGHSLLAMKLIQAIRDETDITLTLKVLLLEPLERLAMMLPGAEAPRPSTPEPTLSRPGLGVLPDRPSVDSGPASREEEGVQSFFFGPRYGHFHPPSGRARGAVLICPPVMQEYMRTHWALRRLAIRLQRRGFAVLRFDYRGCGDGLGNTRDATVAGWIEDVQAAVEELRERSRCEEVTAVGMRLGGALAALAADRPGRIARLALWDPIIDGRDNLQRLRAVHRATMEDPMRYSLVARARRDLLARLGRAVKASDEELIGFALPHRLADRLAAIDVVAQPAQVQSVFVARSLSIPRLDALGEQLIRQGTEVHEQIFDEAGDWYDVTRIEDALLAQKIPAAIVDFVEGGAP